jgi:hypothetical protein
LLNYWNNSLTAGKEIKCVPLEADIYSRCIIDVNTNKTQHKNKGKWSLLFIHSFRKVKSTFETYKLLQRKCLAGWTILK